MQSSTNHCSFSAVQGIIFPYNSGMNHLCKGKDIEYRLFYKLLYILCKRWKVGALYKQGTHVRVLLVELANFLQNILAEFIHIKICPDSVNDDIPELVVLNHSSNAYRDILAMHYL